jgi:Late embryogenesis abundant protein
MLRLCSALAIVAITAGCAGLTQLAQLVQPPQFQQADGRPAEIRIMAPSRTMPAGGAGVRVWLEVTNPNPFGFTLSTLAATLSLEGSHAATGDFPLGLPLNARQDTIVPLDLSISFTDLPGLASALRQIAVGGSVAYQLDGTVGVDAGRLGTPKFGPMRLTQGELRVLR